MDYINGIVEDIGAAIGTEAAMRLIALYGGGSIYVPPHAHQDHSLRKSLGEIPFSRLVAEWGGQTINLPSGDELFHGYQRLRLVANMIRAGAKVRLIAQMLGMKDRQIVNLRIQAENMGLLQRVLSGKGSSISTQMDDLFPPS